MAEYRVLIVEDNPDTRELLREQLTDDRFEVLTAKDGQDAILRVGEVAPDAVVMDVMMPHLDGFETSRYLKLRFRSDFIPILMLTAKSDAASRAQGARYGCEDYRGKPYTRAQLLESLEVLLALGRNENALTSDGDAERIEEARRKVIDLRLELARRQIEEGSTGIARLHAERVLELSDGHAGATELLAKIEEHQES